MKKVLVIFGTRPEAIKMCPVIMELKSRGCFCVKVCVTGQHRQMLDQVLEVFGITPDYDLKVMTSEQTLFDITEKVLSGAREVLQKEKPDVVLVHGDTTTTFAAALAAYYLHISVGHVEAGLRTYDINSPYPEEFNREAVSILADYNFAPTRRAYDNLIREGKKASTIWITGNTVCDALKTTVQDTYSNQNLEWVGNNRLILLTAHRRENLGEPMIHMFKAIKRVLDEHEDVRAIYPIHMNPSVREIAKKIFQGDERIRLIEPLDVVDFHNFMKASYLILTDSGGIQEEAPTLGKPVLVMRDKTERPEGIESGSLRLVGTNEESIYAEFTRLLDDKEEYKKMSYASNPFGDGFASKRIADILEFGRIQTQGIQNGSGELEKAFKQMNIKEEDVCQSGISLDTLQAIYTDYKERIPEYRQILHSFQNEFLTESEQKKSGIQYYRERVKDENHLIEKLIRKRYENLRKYSNIDVNNYREIIQDLIGVRLVVLYKEDFKRVHSWLSKIVHNNFVEGPVAYIREGESKEDYLQWNSKVIIKERGVKEYESIQKRGKGDYEAPRPVYSAMHYIIKYRDTNIEIQVKTMFDEAWGEIDHQIVYPYHQRNDLLLQYSAVLNDVTSVADALSSFIKQKSDESSVKERDKAIPDVREIELSDGAQASETLVRGELSSKVT